MKIEFIIDVKDVSTGDKSHLIIKADDVKHTLEAECDLGAYVIEEPEDLMQVSVVLENLGAREWPMQDGNVGRCGPYKPYGRI